MVNTGRNIDDAGRFFENFTLGEVIEHGTPRTISGGDASLYMALYGSRFAPQTGQATAYGLGYRTRPLDDWLVFHVVFGKTVPDISRNALANLGYAQGRWHQPVYADDTLTVRSKIIGLKPNRDGKTGIIYAHTQAHNQHASEVLDYIRWVMIPKINPESSNRNTSHIPPLARVLMPDTLSLPPLPTNEHHVDIDAYPCGKILRHHDGITIENAEHMLATRLYQNTARVHFDAHAQAKTQFKKRLVYGGHIISIMRSLSFNGLASTYALAGLNGGRHVAPVFDGDTIYGTSIILKSYVPPTRKDIVALRIRHIARKNDDTPLKLKMNAEKLPENTVLDLDLWVWAR